MWGSEAGRERKRDVPTAQSPLRTPLGDTFRKACLSAIWQHSPMVLFSEAPRALVEKGMKSAKLKKQRSSLISA